MGARTFLISSRLRNYALHYGRLPFINVLNVMRSGSMPICIISSATPERICKFNARPQPRPRLPRIPTLRQLHATPRLTRIRQPSSCHIHPILLHSTRAQSTPPYSTQSTPPYSTPPHPTHPATHKATLTPPIAPPDGRLAPRGLTAPLRFVYSNTSHPTR